MRKILIGFIENGKAGGVDRYLLNFFETIWNEEVQIDFLTNEIDKELQKMFEEKNVRLFQTASLKRPVRQYRQVRKLIQKYQYDTVYLNISTAIDCAAAWAAKKENVPMRILHSHASGNDCENVLVRFLFNMIHYFSKITLYHTGTKFYGCSKKAGLWMFPKRIVESERFRVIFNAVDAEKFRYDAQVRNNIRNELGLGNTFVVGHVGNFCYVKNYPFLIDVFAKVMKQIPDAQLILAGNGIQFKDVKHRVREMGLESNVLFLGWRADIEAVFQAMDVFVFPSRFEGLGFVGVEAQLSGLPLVASDRVPEELKITEDCRFLSLNQNPEVWADVIVNSKRENRRELRLLDNIPEFDLKKHSKELKGIVEIGG